MKKILSLVLSALMLMGCAVAFTSCGNDEIIVNTNAFFAPFEYFEGEEIVGVDVEIMKENLYNNALKVFNISPIC